MSYNAFVAAVQALPSTTAVYCSDCGRPFVPMTPAQALTDPAYVHYTGIRQAFIDGDIHPDSQLARDLAALGIAQPMIWRVTRGEPVVTVIWERQ